MAQFVAIFIVAVIFTKKIRDLKVKCNSRPTTDVVFSKSSNSAKKKTPFAMTTISQQGSCSSVKTIGIIQFRFDFARDRHKITDIATSLYEEHQAVFALSRFKLLLTPPP